MKQVKHYTAEQMEQLQVFIDANFGNGSQMQIGHELKSEYVHTDIGVVTTEDGERCFATFGMGARAMKAPLPEFSRAELFMYATGDMDPASKEAMVLMSELQSLSKFPFQNDTWLFHGHTITASELFQQTFGFDAFAVIWTEQAEEIDGIGTMPFLQLIPIYREEREWIMETSTFDGCLLLHKVFDKQIHYADSRREKYIPDAATLQDLKAFLKAKRENA